MNVNLLFSMPIFFFLSPSLPLLLPPSLACSLSVLISPPIIIPPPVLLPPLLFVPPSVLVLPWPFFSFIPEFREASPIAALVFSSQPAVLPPHVIPVMVAAWLRAQGGSSLPPIFAAALHPSIFTASLVSSALSSSLVS